MHSRAQDCPVQASVPAAYVTRSTASHMLQAFRKISSTTEHPVEADSILADTTAHRVRSIFAAVTEFPD